MIRFERLEDFALPESYIYVCSATKSAAVTLTPIYHLGKKRVKKVLILCGADDPENPKGNERNDAVLPAMRLCDFAQKHLGLKVETDIVTINNDADDFAGWEAAAQAAILLSQQAGDIPILVNLTSGTKQMSHAIDHYLTLHDAPWMRLLVGKRPATASLIVPVGNGVKQYWFDNEDEIAAQPPFDVLINAMGVDVIKSEALRIKRSHFARGSETAARLFTALATEDGWEALHAVNVANGNDKKSKNPLNINNHRDEIGKQSSKFNGNGGAALQNCDMIYGAAVGKEYWNGGNLAKGNTRAFLTGGWLEQYILERVKEAVQGKRHFTLHSHVEVRIMDQTDPAHEIDVLLQQDAVFHLIEVKSSTSPKQFFDYAQKLAAINRAVAGRPAQSWIVAPYVRFENEDKREAAISRCLALWQVKLLTGADAIGKLLADIDRLD
jgi:Domain of unknown function (DUF1887)